MRTLSAGLVGEMYKQTSGVAYLTLLEISHPNLTETLYFVDNNVEVTHNLQVYSPMDFKFTLRSQGENPVDASLEIDGVDRSVIQKLRSVSTGLHINVKIVSSLDFDVVEDGPYEFILKGIKYTAYSVKGTLSVEHKLTSSFPQYRFVPKHFPRLY